MKKLLSLFLSICLLVQLTAPAFAAETAGAGTAPRSDTVQETVRPHEKPADLTGTRVSGAQSNPLYGGENNALRGHVTAPKFYSGAAALSTGDYLTDDAAVLEAIASGMEQRKATITVPWRIPASAVSTDEELLNLIFAALALAMSHTGEPTRGDSLLLSYAYLEYGAEVVAYEDGYYYINAVYDKVVYYTTAAQEAELTAKLTEVMNSFGFTAQTDDYTKVKTIYDYICANVTYDEANLNNESYTLKFTPYAALINGTAVCQGYALLLYRMLLMAGVDNRVILGTAENVDHAWNIAALNGLYYNLDSTWDAGQGEYHYFLKCPDNFPNHTRLEAYDSADFHTVYPMALADYIHGENPVIGKGTCGENVTWTLTADGMMTIAGTGAMTDYSDSAMGNDTPWATLRNRILRAEIKRGVTHVGASSFAECSNLQVVIIEDAKTIGKSAFNPCPKLVSVSLPASLKSIGAYTFGGVPALKSVKLTDIGAWCSVNFETASSSPFYFGASLYLNGELVTDLVIPAGVPAVNNYAFYNANIASLVTSETVKSVGDYAFYSSDLTSAVFAEGLLDIGVSAFSETPLEEVTIPATLQTIRNGAFAYTPEGMKIHISDVAHWCALEIGDDSATGFQTLLCINGQPITHLEVPEGTVILKPFTFRQVSNQMTVTLPSTLERIEREAFAYSGVKSVAIPDSVSYIGYFAFGQSKIENITIGNGVETLGYHAFSECKHLKNITFGTGLQELSYGALQDCSSLTSLTLPDGMTTVGKYSLAGCSALESITLPKNLQTVGDYALQDCSSLTSVTFPATLTQTGIKIIIGCNALKDIYFEGDIPTFEGYSLQNGTVKTIIHYPCDKAGWESAAVGKEHWVQEHGEHSEVPAISPTCSNTGLTVGTKCDRCGDFLTPQEIIPKLPHTFEDGVCTVCGAPETLPGDFNGDDLVTDKDAIYLLWHTLFPADYPLPSDADFNGDGLITDKDAIYLLWHTLFPADYPLSV